MTTSTQIKNVKVGACNVSYGGVDLGLTSGGVSVEVRTARKTVMIDTFGSNVVVKDFITSRSGSVKVPLTEHDLNKLYAAIPGSTASIADDTDIVLALVVHSQPGVSLDGIARPLILHPCDLPENDLSEDITIPLAAPTGDIAFAYEAGKQRVYEVEFTMYPNETTGELFKIGDASAPSIPVAPGELKFLVLSNGSYLTTPGGTLLTV